MGRCGRRSSKWSHPPGTDDNAVAASHFLDCLEGKAKPMMSVDLAVKHLGILFQILGV